MAFNAQQKAVGFWIRDGEGSANVVARAGCGKTYTLVRVAVKAIKHFELGTVAIMAYNRNAADEFKTRLGQMGEEFTNQNEIATGTVHSFGLRTWKRYARGAKVDGDKTKDLLRHMQAQVDERINELLSMDTRTVYEDAELEECKELANTLDVGFTSIRKLVSLAKQEGIGIGTSSITDDNEWLRLCEHYGIEVEDGESTEALLSLISAAQDLLKLSIEQNHEVIDFDDMIYAPLYHNSRFYQFDWVLLDEAQDTNKTRRMLAMKMMKHNGRMIAVGDPKQAIYGFTGADSNSMELIQHQLKSVELPLTITYRCPKAVVAEANRLVPDLLADESAPEGIVRRIDTNIDPLWYGTLELTADDAILCRNTAPLVDLAYRMLRDGIACHVEGRDIAEGLLKLAARWKRVRSLSVLIDHVKDYAEREIAKATASDKAAAAQSIEDKCNAFVVIAERLVESGRKDVSDFTAFVNRLFEDTPENGKARVVTLSTIHKAKGREWNRVVILNRRELIPSKYAKKPWQLEQEYNLEYVAITRAKHELIDVVEPKKGA